MTRTLTVLLAALALAASVCKKPPMPPDRPSEPSGFTHGDPGTAHKLKSTTTDPNHDSIAIRFSWGDGDTSSWSDWVASGETVAMTHTWSDTVNCEVTAQARDLPGLESDWSEPHAVFLATRPPDRPSAPTGPDRARTDSLCGFTAVATDPDGDSVCYRFYWDDGDTSGWTAPVASGQSGSAIHAWSDSGTYWVRAQACDIYGARSQWSTCSTSVRVDPPGIVLWTWVSPDEDSGPPLGSALMAMHDAGELVYVGARDRYGKFYGIDITDGRTKERGSGNEPGVRFTGHPALCTATGNIIVGCEDGELYGFTTGLSRNWNWPDSSEPTNIEWGVPAINGTRVYCTRADDRLYCLDDGGSSVSYVASSPVHGIRGNPVIDNTGQVIVVTDSGRLRVFDADLDPNWDTLLTPDHRPLFSPAVDASGVVYVGDRSGYVYAVNPNHSIKWRQQVSGEANRIVLGIHAVYVATSTGKLYKLHPTTGTMIWNITLTGASEVTVSPILTDDGLIYIQDQEDVLHCIKQDDGSYIWRCDCRAQTPMRFPGRGRDFESPAYSPGIASTGDIIVVGADALYCVSGYIAAALLASPWPKWQGGSANTGRPEGQ